MRRIAGFVLGLLAASGCGATGSVAASRAPRATAVQTPAIAAPTTASVPPLRERSPCEPMPVERVLACDSLEGAAPASGWEAEFIEAHDAVRRESRSGSARRPTAESQSLAERPFSATEERAARAGRHVLCAAPRPWADAEIVYAVARVYYDADHFREAASLFDALLRDAPRHELGEYAANLALDSVNVLLGAADDAGSDGALCSATLRTWAREYGVIVACGSAGAPVDLCDTLERLRCSLILHDAETNAGQGDDARASTLYESAYATHCGGRGDEALFNAAELAARAGDPARARALRAQLRLMFPESPLNVAP